MGKSEMQPFSLFDYVLFSLPNFIGSFTKLEYLNLSNAGFSGAIPHTFGNLSCLRYLDLSSNYDLQTNDLHWLSGMTSLWWHLCYYRSASLSQLHISSCADLSHNNGLNITLPQWLFNLTSLVHLELSACALYGKLPVTVGNLSRLRVLNLSGNHFDGVIPESLGNLGSLESLDLSDNELNGSIPESLSNLTNLVFFDLSYNKFGKLPESIGRLQKLVEFHLSNNQIQGLMPASIGDLRNLQYLDLSQNMISGAIPESFGNLTLLQHFDGAVNNLRGKLPETMGNFIHLQFLYLSQNMIAGELPGSMGKLTSLTVLDLSMNNISGILPKSMGNLCKLQWLDLSSNLIKGAIDDLVNRLSNCPENYIRNSSSVSEDTDGMSYLNLANNRFNGRVPDSIGRLANLRILQLKENSFVGTLTEHHFLNLTDLYYMDFSYNLLQLNVPNDWVPPFYADTIMMCSCRISSVFPAWLKTQTGLEYLCLSEAEISGNVPTWFWNLSSNGLVLLNISHNNLSGIHLLLQHSSLEIIDMSRNKFEAYHLCNLTILKNAGSVSNNMRLENFHIAGISFLVQYLHGLEVLASLVFLRLRSNLFEGSIPEQLLNLSSLQVLDLAQNNLSVVIFPHTFGGFKVMATSYSERSRLLISQYDQERNFTNVSGTYEYLESRACPIAAERTRNPLDMVLFRGGHGWFNPIKCREAADLMGLFRTGNRISAWLKNFETHLNDIFAYRCRISGLIPKMEDVGFLQVIDLSNNSISGPIPSFFSLAESIEVFSLANNHISGC
ncbi:probable leucine-rich repeat receptor-like protein kinase At1g35710 [Dioscorea cayenensis subsp. rotundata]|uniref:Probable leucine-rich repeat receptor-like protein kinase At1g35710 n=1 Tax=Dioscorea cayennensis subsp. rotundata TaxID=55577 RepID=A0AB40C8X2_DIOCR|nr:probable leucine-rich repeat receptor-like protein kinase At1g35710 [Dioscorea cayenensis subsp. rotundata]